MCHRELYTWGHGDSGRLGHGDNITEKEPRKVALLASSGYHAVSVAVGDKYNLILVTDAASRKQTSGRSDI